jgi:hypothetical protein
LTMVSTTPCINKSLESLDASAKVKAILFPSLISY